MDHAQIRVHQRKTARVHFGVMQHQLVKPRGYAGFIRRAAREAVLGDPGQFEGFQGEPRDLKDALGAHRVLGEPLQG